MSSLRNVTRDVTGSIAFDPGKGTFNAGSNLLTYSEDAGNSTWMKSNVSVDDDAATAPDGTSTMDRLNVLAVADQRAVIQAVTIIPGYTYTLSAHVKSDGSGFATISLADAGEYYYGATFNLSTGAMTQIGVGATSGVHAASGSINVGNGVYRVWVTGNISGNNGGAFSYVADSTAGTFTKNAVGLDTNTGVAGEDILMWGIQLNKGSLAPYVKTVEAPAK